MLTLQYSRELDGHAQTNIYDQTRSYPAGEGKIRVVSEDFPGRHQVYQENWYDALGRRVMVRAREVRQLN